MLKQDITSRLLINSFHLKNSCLRPAGKRLHLLLCLLRAVRVSVEACTRACAAGGWRTSSTSPTPGERARLSQVSHQTISPISCLWQHFSAEDRLVCRFSRSALDCKTPQNEEQRRSPQTLVSTADICLGLFSGTCSYHSCFICLRYVLLKEKNVLLTLQQEARRQSVQMPSPERLRKVRVMFQTSLGGLKKC